MEAIIILLLKNRVNIAQKKYYKHNQIKMKNLKYSLIFLLVGYKPAASFSQIQYT
jgi:hypothetical protein